MGEQSVRKSFTLNHFVDTSFAGSVMHTTGLFKLFTLQERTPDSVNVEGVWMSISPTEEVLIAALYFKGELNTPSQMG
jgi:hypothetical protein